MAATREDLPENIDALKAVLLVERARAVRVEAELAVAKAKASDDDALIAHQRLQIEKLTRQLYGQHSERTARLIDQMELAFEELESSASEDEIAAARAAAKTTNVVAFTRTARRASPSPRACRASGWSSRDPPPACAAAARDCVNWARTSPKRWR